LQTLLTCMMLHSAQRSRGRPAATPQCGGKAPQAPGGMPASAGSGWVRLANATACVHASAEDASYGSGPLVVLGLYICGIMGIAVLGYRHRAEDTMDDHYLARGSLGNTVLVLSTFASLFSGYTVIGVPGNAYRQGYFAFYWVPGTIAIASCNLLVAPRLFALATVRRYITPGAFIYDRWRSDYMRVVSSACFLLPMFLYIMAQFKSIAALVDGFVPPDAPLSGFGAVCAMAALMLAYETLGGMRSVAWTDAVQGALMLACFGALVLMSYTELGGLPSAGRSMAREMPSRVAVPDGAQLQRWISFTLLVGISYPLNPLVMQRVFAARSVGQLRTVYSFMAFGAFAATIPALIVGWTAVPLVCGAGACLPSPEPTIGWSQPSQCLGDGHTCPDGSPCLGGSPGGGSNGAGGGAGCSQLGLGSSCPGAASVASF
jgi:Na+/proline symporter